MKEKNQGREKVSLAVSLMNYDTRIATGREERVVEGEKGREWWWNTNVNR